MCRKSWTRVTRVPTCYPAVTLVIVQYHHEGEVLSPRAWHRPRAQAESSLTTVTPEHRGVKPGKCPLFHLWSATFLFHRLLKLTCLQETGPSVKSWATLSWGTKVQTKSLFCGVGNVRVAFPLTVISKASNKQIIKNVLGNFSSPVIAETKAENCSSL